MLSVTIGGPDLWVWLTTVYLVGSYWFGLIELRWMAKVDPSLPLGVVGLIWFVSPVWVPFPLAGRLIGRGVRTWDANGIPKQDRPGSPGA